MKIFMTGATGFVGKHIAARLVEDGHQLGCLVRSAESEDTWYLKGIEAEIVEGDIHSVKSLASGAAGCDAVIHLVGIIFERRGASFEQVHVEGTRNMLAAAKQAGVSRFVHMSALGTMVDATGAYHRTKWDAPRRMSAPAGSTTRSSVPPSFMARAVSSSTCWRGRCADCLWCLLLAMAVIACNQSRCSM